MVAFDRLGRLVNIIPYVCMVCMHAKHNNITQGFSGIQIGRSDPYMDNLILSNTLRIQRI